MQSLQTPVQEQDANPNKEWLQWVKIDVKMLEMQRENCRENVGRLNRANDWLRYERNLWKAHHVGLDDGVLRKGVRAHRKVAAAWKKCLKG